MVLSLTGRFWTAPLLVVAAFIMAGCNGTTYGTGRSPGMQTLKDFAGLAALGGDKEEPIDYSARAPVVAPPDASALPPPGGATRIGSTDWPDDPDVRAERIRQQVAVQSQQIGSNGRPRYSPNFRLPPGASPPQPARRPDISASEAARLTPEQKERALKAFADARRNLEFDADGNPVRRYLSDPPAEYRVGDPDAPVEVTKKCPKKGKFRWPWQKKKPGC
ncbi:MAG: hypothetical protein ACTSP2_04990 [Alphaproteobacteria bacterium]